MRGGRFLSAEKIGGSLWLAVAVRVTSPANLADANDSRDVSAFRSRVLRRPPPGAGDSIPALFSLRDEVLHGPPPLPFRVPLGASAAAPQTNVTAP